MQKRCRQNKATGIGKFASRADFTAVGMAVTNAEHPHQCRTHAKWQAQCKGDNDTQNHDRCQNERFDVGQRNAGKREQETDDHRTDEGGRQSPDGAPAKKGGPKANGNHRQHVIGTEQWMREAGGKGAVFGRIQMGKGGRGGQQAECGGKAEAVEHEMFLRLVTPVPRDGSHRS